MKLAFLSANQTLKNSTNKSLAKNYSKHPKSSFLFPFPPSTRRRRKIPGFVFFGGFCCISALPRRNFRRAASRKSSWKKQLEKADWEKMRTFCFGCFRHAFCSAGSGTGSQIMSQTLARTVCYPNLINYGGFRSPFLGRS